MIQLNRVNKQYGGFHAITNVSFDVEPGEVVGLLGPNGAGKSTVMKIISGFMSPTRGEVVVAGHDMVSESLEARRHIGYMPETVPLYSDMKVEAYLRFMGRIRGMSRQYICRRIEEVVAICQLEDYQSTFISKLSKGFRQRLGVAQAILHEPDVLILDEPTIGIDPIQVVETRQLIKSMGGNHTVLVSTHILSEASMLCGRVVVIHEGEVVAVDSPDNLASALSIARRIELDVHGPAHGLMSALSILEGVENVIRVPDVNARVSRYVLMIEPTMEMRAQVASTVVQGGWDLLRLESVGMTLEEIFLRLTADENGEEI